MEQEDINNEDMYDFSRLLKAEKEYEEALFAYEASVNSMLTTLAKLIAEMHN